VAESLKQRSALDREFHVGSDPRPSGYWRL
jgi:hypothetical protein